jgi:2-oxoglutarate dehydrogenase E2 component (dihydrolipoamide succinyltransferase)
VGGCTTIWSLTERILKAEGDTVRVGEPMAIVSDGLTEATPAENPMLGQAKPTTPLARKIAAEQAVEIERVTGSGAAGRVTRADVSRWIQAEAPSPEPETTGDERGNGGQPERVARSGSRGATPDVGTPKPELDVREERVKLSRRRLTIAERLLEAQHSTASLTTFSRRSTRST